MAIVKHSFMRFIFCVDGGNNCVFVCDVMRPMLALNRAVYRILVTFIEKNKQQHISTEIKHTFFFV